MTPYHPHKNGCVKLIDDVPNGWVVSRIKYVAKIFGRIGYRGYKTEDIVDKGEGVISLSPSNIADQKLDLSHNTYISWDKYYESPEIMVKPGDIVIVKTSSVGKISHIPNNVPEMTLNPQLIVLKNIKPSPRFLYYFMICNYFQHNLYVETTGGVTPTISQEKINNITIVLPKIEEQHQISNYLDYKIRQIDFLIGNIQRKIQLLIEHRTSMINKVMTKGLDPNAEMKDSCIEWIGEIPCNWMISKLRYQIAGIKDGTHGSHPNVEEGKILLSGKNVIDGYLNITDNERIISEEDHQKIIMNGFPQTEDILFVSIGSIGKVCIFEKDEPISFQRSVCFIRPKKHITSKFLYYSLRSNYSQVQIKHLTNQSTIGGIYMGDLVETVLPIPIYEEQKLICDYLDTEVSKFDQLFAKETQRIEVIKEYRQSLISEIVTGKVDVSNEVVS